MKYIFALAAVVFCFFAGNYVGPKLKQTWEEISNPSVKEGNYQEIYQQANNDIVIFATSTCPYCQEVRKLFNSQNIPYKEYTIDQSTDAKVLYESLNLDGSVPVTFIGNYRIRGFLSDEIQTALKSIEKP